MRCAPRLCGRGGQWGGGLPCLVPSLCLSWAGNKAGVAGVALVMEGVAPIPLPFMLACRLRARSMWRPGALARVRLFCVGPAGAGGWGGGAGLAPASLSGAAFLPGGGGIIPSASGGWRPAPPRLAGRCGGVGGGSRRGPPALPLGGSLRLPTQPPFRRRRVPPRRRRSVGVAGLPRAPGVACLAGGGGGRGGQRTAPPEAQPDPARPSALPERATLRVSLAILFRFVVACRLRAWSLCRSGAREQAVGGAEARIVRVQLRPPPGRRGPCRGRGDVPSAPGGRRAGAPVAPRLGGERGGEGGGGWAAPLLPAPLPR